MSEARCMTQLSQKQIEQIRLLKKQGYTFPVLHERFKVGVARLRRIVRENAGTKADNANN